VVYLPYLLVLIPGMFLVMKRDEPEGPMYLSLLGSNTVVAQPDFTVKFREIFANQEKLPEKVKSPIWRLTLTQMCQLAA
jgi:hypothetical protein